MTVFEMLNLRYEFEELARNFKLQNGIKHGTLDTMKGFLETSGKHNRFRDGYARAEEICKMIITYEETRVPFV